MIEPEWLKKRRREVFQVPVSLPSHHEDWFGKLVADKGFNNHTLNDGTHVSPFDNGALHIGTDGLTVRLVQGVDEQALTNVLSRALRATTGIPHTDNDPPSAEDRDEMLRGGLQAALESQVIVFEVRGASRALTHQLVRTRKAAFHQQSQRATYYGDDPDIRVPASIVNLPGESGNRVRRAWETAIEATREAYRAACDVGVSYQDARYILAEGTTNYILCEYTIREFISVFAYRGCSMFLWEMVACMRMMREALLSQHPFLEPHVKISCERTGEECPKCFGSGYLHLDDVPATSAEIDNWSISDDPNYELKRCWACEGLGGQGRHCTFQGWENVEGVCDFPWARQDNRTFLPTPKYRIGAQ